MADSYTPAQLQSYADQVATEYGIPVPLFRALINQESGWQTDVTSSAGAHGPAQLMPGTARGLGVDINNPLQNILGGAKYLRQQFDSFGTWPIALAAYNAGPGAVHAAGGKIPQNSETPNYVNIIMKNAGGSAMTLPKAPAAGSSGADTGITADDRKAIRNQIVQALTAAQAAYQKNPQDALALSRYGDLLDYLNKFDSDKLNLAILKNAPAQQDFENALKLSDLTLKQADSAWNQYVGKAGQARLAADTEVAGIQKQQAGLGAARRDEWDANGTIAPSDAAGYRSADYSDVMTKWQKRFGADKLPEIPSGPDGGGGGGGIDPGMSIDKVPAISSGGGGVTSQHDTKAPGEPGYRVPGIAYPYGSPQFPATGDGTFSSTVQGAPTGSDNPFASGSGSWLSNLNPFNLHGQDYPFQDVGRSIRNHIPGFGRGTANAPGGMALVNDRPKGKVPPTWWKGMTNQSAWKSGMPGVLSHATGTAHHPGGPAAVNDGGGAEIVMAPGDEPRQLPGGPQVTNLPAGSAVVPANVPPQEAYQFLQLKQAANHPVADPNSPEAQQARANDPQLEQKVLASIERALIAELAAHPPATPPLAHGGNDHFAHLRGLTGVPRDPVLAQQMAEASAKGAR